MAKRKPKTPLCECGRPVCGDRNGTKMCAVCLARQYNVGPDVAGSASPKTDVPMPSMSAPTDDPLTWAKTVAASANDLASIFGIRSQRAIRDYELSLALGAEMDRENDDREAQDRREREELEAQIRRQEADRLSGNIGWGYGGKL